MLATRLKSLRKERGIKQRELAEAVQLSTSAIAMYETANRDPDTATLQKLADFFDVSLDYLLGRSDVQQMYRGDCTVDLLREDSAEYGAILGDIKDERKVKFYNKIINAMENNGIVKEYVELESEEEGKGNLIFDRFDKLMVIYLTVWKDKDKDQDQDQD